MNKISKRTIKIIAFAQICVITLLAGCASVTYPQTVCHATTDPANPYTAIIVNNANELLLHSGHSSDLIPMPVGGCPTTPVEANNGKITICHATGSDKNPYNEITISINGLEGHAKHEGDNIPMPVGGCPTTPLVPKEQGKK